MNKTQFLPRFYLFTLAKAGYRFNANINLRPQTPQANVGKSTLKQAAVLVPLFEKISNCIFYLLYEPHT